MDVSKFGRVACRLYHRDTALLGRVLRMVCRTAEIVGTAESVPEAWGQVCGVWAPEGPDGPEEPEGVEVACGLIDAVKAALVKKFPGGPRPWLACHCGDEHAFHPPELCFGDPQTHAGVQ